MNSALEKGDEDDANHSIAPGETVMNLSTTMRRQLQHLHDAVSGEPDVYVWASNELHHNTARALERRGLICYETVRRSPDKWYRAAITRAGVVILNHVRTSTSRTSTEKRVRVRFNVDLMKADHRDAHAHITHLTEQRQLTSAMVDMMRLHADLSAGRVEVFMQMFPHLIPVLAGEICDVPAPSVDFERMMQAINELKTQVGRPQMVPGVVRERQPVPVAAAVDVEESSVSGDEIAHNILDSLF